MSSSATTWPFQAGLYCVSWLGSALTCSLITYVMPLTLTYECVATHKTCPNILTPSLHWRMNQVTVADQSDSLRMATVWLEIRLCNSFVNFPSLLSLSAYSSSFSDASVSETCRCRISLQKSVWEAEMRLDPCDAVRDALERLFFNIFLYQIISMLESTAMKSIRFMLCQVSQILLCMMCFKTSNQTAVCAKFVFISRLSSTLTV